MNPSEQDDVTDKPPRSETEVGSEGVLNQQCTAESKDPGLAPRGGGPDGGTTAHRGREGMTQAQGGCWAGVQGAGRATPGGETG